MRKPIRVGPLLFAGALLATAVPAARANTIALQGQRLALTSGGDTEISIEADPSLDGALRIIGDQLDCVQAQAGDTIAISTAGCGDTLGHLTLLVPSRFQIALAMQGDGDVHVGGVGGALTATMDSDGSLSVGTVQSLMLAVHGSGDASIADVAGAADVELSSNGGVKLNDVRGPLHARLSGSGDLAVGAINAAAVDIGDDGDGDVSLGVGAIGALRARTNGSGDINVAAQVGTADLQASGGGDIRVSGASGQVRRSASGGSSIHVGGHDDQTELQGLQALRGLKVDLSNDDAPETTHHGGSAAGHVVAGLLVLGVLFLIWRTVRRHGGWPTTRSRGPVPGAVTHPGVLAVRDALVRLDARLAQVESYVTSREFDLHKKFRELDRR